VIFRGQVPFGRVNFDGDAEVRPPRVRPGDERPVRVVERRVEQRHRDPGPDQQVPEIRLRGGPDSLRHVRQRLPEQRRAGPRACAQLGGQVPYLAGPALDGTGHDGSHVAQAGQAAHGIGDGTGRGHVPDRAALPDPLRHPGGPVQPDELRVAALPGRRDQDIDQVRHGAADVVAAQRGGAGDHAAAARVQQGGHLLLKRRRSPRRGHEYARQQCVPRPSGPEPVPQRTVRQPGGRHLTARDDAKLVKEDPVEGIRNGSRGSGHGDIMRLRSDKTLSHRCRILPTLLASCSYRPGRRPCPGMPFGTGCAGAFGLMGETVRRDCARGIGGGQEAQVAAG
jgi:hypothetical protein